MRIPPRFSEWILCRLLEEDEKEFIIGDLREMFGEAERSSGKIRANIWYWGQIARSIPPFLSNKIFWRIVMFGHFLKLAWRNMRKRWGYTLINVLGLAIGVACCLLIFLWVRFELSYDRFHASAREIYRVVSEHRSPGGEINYGLTSPAPLGAVLKDNYPEIIDSARALSADWKMGTGTERFEVSTWFTDPAFLDMFTFDFVLGSPATALADPNSVVLTQTSARKQFPNTDPLGKTILGGQNTPLTVTAVIKDIPPNSHLDIDAIVPLAITEEGNSLTEWRGYNYRTYVQLQKGSSGSDVQQKVRHVLENYMPGTRTTIRLQALTEIHLFDLEGGGLITYIYVFSIMALFVLLIACFNYMSLSSAKASVRAKEVGVRQVMGARREQLIGQFLGESSLLAFFATALALGLAQALLPIFQRLAGREIAVSHSLGTLGLAAGIAAFTGIVSGSYPALVLSRAKPSGIFKGIFRSGRGGILFRKLLVIAQFSLSIFFIFATFVIGKQIHLLRNKDLGYDKENIICLNSLDGIAQNYPAVRDRLLNHPHVVGLTVVDSFLDMPNSSATSDVISWEGQKAGEVIPWLVVRGVDFDFQKTFGIEMAEGRFFSREFPSDRQEGMVVNEAAVKAMNMDSPVGKTFHFWDYDGTIIGVIKDFHFQSLHSTIEPMVMKIGINLQRMAIRIRSQDMAAAINSIETEIKKIVPGFSSEFEFLDEKLDRLYWAEQRMENITKAISCLAIFISCLGLIGLAAFTAEQKTKEIGIRKVLGASTSGVIALLSREFLKWVVLANLIAWPIGYLAMRSWLRNFAYQTSLTVLMFLGPGMAALFIAAAVISLQTYRAAAANPADSIRYE